MDLNSITTYLKNGWLRMKLKCIVHLNEGKDVVIETFNHTLKNKMYKDFTANNTYKYVDVLPDLINEYNNHKHSTIKMTPAEASMKYNEKVIQNDVCSTMIKPSINLSLWWETE